MTSDDNDDRDTLSLTELERIVSLCGRFEEAWRAGDRPRIETFLTEIDNHDALFVELLTLELELRRHAGEVLSRDDYRGRFADHSTVIDAVFAAELAARQGLAPERRRPRAGARSNRPLSPPEGLGWETDPVRTNVSAAEPAVDLGTKPGPDQATSSLDRYQACEGPASIPSSSTDVSDADPPRIGRYSVVRRLGEGGFGKVYLARDEDLNRMVAIKVPRRQAFRTTHKIEVLLNEARMAAQFRHPAIVGVHDIGRQPDGSVYIVLEYVDGQTLSEVLKTGGLPLERLVALLARVAEAVHYAHKQGLVHRDLKPANILVDSEGNPRVADFGLAVHEDFQRFRTGEVAGTVPYMAPEQVQGETHRLDGRTDVWALGVILYGILAGRRPFSGDFAALKEEICHHEPKPPRQIDDSVPRELDRICLKCLSKRMTDRYSSALDLADDLRAWLGAARSPGAELAGVAKRRRVDAPARSGAIWIGPKGPRPFDWSDADLFLNLLPGLVGRDGLPESVRFWKSRIEDRGGDTAAMSVGLLYGPSGGGKSSLVRAGVLPRLDERAHPVYLEASPGRTEAQLAAALKHSLPALPDGCGLTEALAAIREGDLVPSGVKVLLVLDQFEQWLQAHPDEPRAELIRALRQCDGERLQALLLVRDDFWMAITRFFRALEVPLAEGVNSAAVELPDMRHARSVLDTFGRACGKFSGPSGNPSVEEARFLDLAVTELAGPDGRVVPVRISLLVEVIRHRPWTTATLKELGGMDGIGVTFLAETFDSPSAPPLHRAHRGAAEAVLQALLPPPPSLLRTQARPARELRAAAGYVERPHDFAELLRVLDSGLRLISIIDPEGGVEPDGAALACTEPPGTGVREPSYQLAHDYLVDPIRRWVERKKRSSPSGRARLRLEAIAGAWSERPENRRLASPAEWMNILWYTRPRSWTAVERRMMRAATRRHLVRPAALLAVSALVVFVGFELRERDHTSLLLDNVLKADPRMLPEQLPEFAQYRDRLRPELERIEHDINGQPDHVRARAGLLLYPHFPNSARADALIKGIPSASPEDLGLFREALSRSVYRDPALARRLRDGLFNESAEPGARLRFAGSLARLDPGGVSDWIPVAAVLTDALLAEDRRAVSRWLDMLAPALTLFVQRLAEVCKDAGREPTERSHAAETLAAVLDRTGDDRNLALAITDSRPDASRILLRELPRFKSTNHAREALRKVLSEPPAEPADDAGAETLAARQAAAAVALAALGDRDDFWPLFRHKLDPRLRTRVIHALARCDVIGPIALPRLALPREQVGADERQALWMALAESNRDTLSVEERARAASAAAAAYVDDPDAGVHSATWLLLRRWDHGELVTRGDERIAKRPAPDKPVDHGWARGPNGHTLVTLRGPLEYRMGSPAHEAWRFPREAPHRRRIDRSLDVSATEVTVEQFLAFKPGHKTDPRHGTDPDAPIHEITWFDAVGYCNWLSRKAGLEPCYPLEARAGMMVSAEAGNKAGYRLPSEAEWEFFCRASTETARPFGSSDELLPRYGWTWLNSGNKIHPVAMLLPNELGLFDVLGNAWEWCHDGAPPDGVPAPDREGYPFYPAGTLERPAHDPFAGFTVQARSWRILRGGGFPYAPSEARSANRYTVEVGLNDPYVGFRVVRTIE